MSRKASVAIAVWSSSSSLAAHSLRYSRAKRTAARPSPARTFSRNCCRRNWNSNRLLALRSFDLCASHHCRASVNCPSCKLRATCDASAKRVSSVSSSMSALRARSLAASEYPSRRRWSTSTRFKRHRRHSSTDSRFRSDLVPGNSVRYPMRAFTRAMCLVSSSWVSCSLRFRPWRRFMCPSKESHNACLLSRPVGGVSAASAA
mmetsp:Transcript_7411/g.27207  ORF Transcript_7411/g.27207 Transcript_7411/m.27207 type:complete len:204 (+) Transcript_7411:243-854(+)